MAEDKLNLRKQLLEQATTKQNSVQQDSVDPGARNSSLMEIEFKMSELERVCQEQRHSRETWQGEAEALKTRLKQAQEKV